MLHIVFDFGGVLFRWNPADFLARVWPERAHSPEAAQAVADEFFTAYTGDWGLFDQGLIGAEEVTDRISARTGWPRDEVASAVAQVPQELQLQVGTAALIQDLRRAGHRLFYLSNMPEPYADHLEALHPLTEWFEAGVFSGRDKLSKPSPEVFVAATARYGVAPQDCLLLDDMPANIEAAQAFGWQALLFTDADSARQQLRSRGVQV